MGGRSSRDGREEFKRWEGGVQEMGGRSSRDGREEFKRWEGEGVLESMTRTCSQDIR